MCAALERTFAATDGWDRHDTFYQCWMRDITESVPDDLRAPLIRRMAAVTGMPLTDQLKVTAQRMLPGDQALPHSDRPLLGYEAVRLVVQLTRGWAPDQGGLFLVHPDEGATTTRTHEPRFDTAVGFAMGPGTQHTVTPVLSGERRTVVFNFWHAGNTPAVRDRLRDLFGAMRFSDLPRDLDPHIDEAERTHDDEATLRAATAAYALMRWGHPTPTLLRAYAAALHPWDPSVEPGPDGPAIAAARWVTRLWHDDFDPRAYGRLDPRVLDLLG